MSLSATSPRAPDLSGCALDGRYELHALIGEGAFGRVYRGRDRRLARPVAVKVIKPWWAEDPDWVRSFEREAQLMASVSDQGIVQIYDVGHAEEGLYYVAELVDGESVAARLRRGPIAPQEACDVAEQITRALDAAHAHRIVHRDIKPANIMISSGGRVKIADFGVAGLLGGDSSHGSATLIGTPAYMAPEHASGHEATPASDTYSVGVVLFEMLAGRPPFTGGSPIELALAHLQDSPPPLPSEIPEALRSVVERSLAKDPARRYRDGGEMAAALGRTRTSGSTKPIPGGAADTAAGAAKTPTDRDPRTMVAPWTSPRRNVYPAARRRTAAAFAFVFLLLAAMVSTALVTGSAAQVKVPSLRGLTRGAIRAKLARAHLHVGFRSRYSTAPAHTAIAQDPSAGTHVAEGSRLVATLSAGPPPVAVPRVIGFATADARGAIEQLGLHSSVTEVPAPGAAPGTVTAQDPAWGLKRLPGATVSLTVAQSPRWRPLTVFTDRGGQASPPFRIRGSRWRVVYSMSYSGTCTFIFVCSGPTAHVVNIDRGTDSAFDLSEGSGQVRMFGSGPGVYQVKIAPGDDSTRWSAEVQDYY